VREYRSRGGVSLNLEQQIVSDVGFFARAGWANGDIEPYEFTDIDRTVSAGLSVQGKKWGRPDDTWGIAGVVNEISKEHQAFLDDGGLGILVGDGPASASRSRADPRDILQFPGVLLARHLRLPIHRQSRLQP
jgi:high affinity Mn2+ porin